MDNIIIIIRIGRSEDKYNNNKEKSPHCQQRPQQPQELKRMPSPFPFVLNASQRMYPLHLRRGCLAIEKGQQDGHNNIIIAECGDLGTGLVEKLAMITRSGHCRC